MKKNLIITGVIISILFFSITVCLQIEGQIEQEDESAKLNALSTHGPIDIKTNADFSSYAIISGAGSIGDPYLIDSLNITVVSGIGISISTVSVHFIIQNCYIEAESPIILDTCTSLNSSIIGNTLDPIGSNIGLYLNYTGGIDIIGNSFFSGITGIYGEYSHTMYVYNNYFTETYNALDLINCNSADIINNLFEENDGDQYVHCFGLEIYNNTWLNNENGLYLGDCDSSAVQDNFFLHNTNYGVTLHSSINIAVYENWFVDNNPSGDSQAIDQAGTNLWHWGVSGNFWSDYSGEGAYAIDEGSYDPHPIYDSDNDELNDYEEIYIYFTDPYNPDHDHDGLPDGYEVDNALDPHIDDANEDADSDGLSNLDEYFHQTYPRDADTDKDSMTDGYEVENSLNPLFDDADLDGDGDGLTNYEEFLLGTKANQDDSDDDGMNDGWEIANGLDPLSNDAWADPDNDNLNNFLEYIYGCNPFNNDTDGDSHQDGWEVLHGTNPNDSTDFPDESMETLESSFALFIGIFAVLLLSGLFLRRKR